MAARGVSFMVVQRRLRVMIESGEELFEGTAANRERLQIVTAMKERGIDRNQLKGEGVEKRRKKTDTRRRVARSSIFHNAAQI